MGLRGRGARRSRPRARGGRAPAPPGSTRPIAVARRARRRSPSARCVLSRYDLWPARSRSPRSPRSSARRERLGLGRARARGRSEDLPARASPGRARLDGAAARDAGGSGSVSGASPPCSLVCFVPFADPRPGRRCRTASARSSGGRSRSRASAPRSSSPPQQLGIYDADGRRTRTARRTSPARCPTRSPPSRPRSRCVAVGARLGALRRADRRRARAARRVRRRRSPPSSPSGRCSRRSSSSGSSRSCPPSPARVGWRRAPCSSSSPSSPRSSGSRSATGTWSTLAAGRLARPRPQRPARRALRDPARRRSVDGDAKRLAARSAAARRRTRPAAPSMRTSPSAGWKRTGIAVRIRSIASSARTPMTESCGPVMPASVIAAVPPGCTRASFVCTWVCVPITAVTRPSSMRASAIFSLVASAWKSTTTIRRLRAGPPRRARRRRGTGSCGGERKSAPWRLTTATGVPSAAGCTVRPAGSRPAEVLRAEDAARPARAPG